MTAGTIVQVDPKTLLVGANVRKEVNLNKEFTASIKERGVLIPIVAYETPEGLVVEEGQRRTLAAVDVELATVPVYVREAPTEADRIIDQVVANEHRAELSTADGIAAVQELALFDVKAPVIAKKMGLPREFVDQAMKVGASKVASDGLQAGQLSFESALLLAEFDDFPEEQAELLALVDSEWRIENRADQLRSAREKAAAEDAIAALGVTVIQEPEYYSSDPLRVRYLYLDESLTEELSEVEHERLVELAGDGLCAYANQGWDDGVRVWRPVYAVKGWAERGLFTHSYRIRDAEKPQTPEQKEALKAERRAAREATKAWKEATVARVEFLQGLVKRKTMPKGWEPLVIGRLLSNASHGSDEWRMAIAILGLRESTDSYSLRGVVEAHLVKAPARALHVGLAVWAGSIEGGFEFDRKGWAQSDTKKYLDQLEAWGHVLSESELAVVGRKKGKAAA